MKLGRFINFTKTKTVRGTTAIRSSSGLSRFPTLAIGKASDQAAVFAG